LQHPLQDMIQPRVWPPFTRPRLRPGAMIVHARSRARPVSCQRLWVCLGGGAAHLPPSFPALEAEGVGDHPHREDALVFGHLGHHGGSARPRAATHPRSDEHLPAVCFASFTADRREQPGGIPAPTGSSHGWRKALNLTRLPSTPFVARSGRAVSVLWARDFWGGRGCACSQPTTTDSIDHGGCSQERNTMPALPTAALSLLATMCQIFCVPYRRSEGKGGGAQVDEQQCV